MKYFEIKDRIEGAQRLMAIKGKTQKGERNCLMAVLVCAQRLMAIKGKTLPSPEHGGHMSLNCAQRLMAIKGKTLVARPQEQIRESPVLNA